MLAQHETQSLNIAGTFHIPEGAPNPEFVLPDEVVAYMAAAYGLCKPNMRGIDPMCGTGTIPRVINRAGGCCDGIDLDPAHVAIARQEVAPGRLPLDNGYIDLANRFKPGSPYGRFALAGEILFGDCTIITPPNRTRGGKLSPYHYIYTSIPFSLILAPELDDRIIQAFDRMLMPGGYLIIDSAEVAERDGLPCHPAAATVEIMRRNGYTLRDHVRFNTDSPEGCDSQFSELLFTRTEEFWLDADAILET